MNTTVERACYERARSVALREQAELLSQRLVDALRSSPARSIASGDTFALRLARVRPAVALARHSISRWLEQRGVAAEHVHVIVLAASEACANAVEHPVSSSHAAFDVEAAHRDDEVVVVVRDSGHWRPEATNDARGRGLRMIRSLMTEVEVVRGENGTEIVMRRRLD
jgi:anti-sigma regulatory factor (Ser/Thr protein kinase)